MNTVQRVVHGSYYLCGLVAALWILSYLAARYILREVPLEPWLQIAVALVPIVPTAVFLWLLVTNLRHLDELHRRVHLEALAIAFPLAILLLWTLGLLQLVMELPSEDWSYRHVWAFLPLFYFIGLAIAWQRYQ
ncbi:MAG: hypothetical protein J5I93_16730 [Pirellulaceae bacterium]|nr:hypothetical protein [Pirellulaceae bacterium]